MLSVSVLRALIWALNLFSWRIFPIYLSFSYSWICLTQHYYDTFIIINLKQSTVIIILILNIRSLTSNSNLLKAKHSRLPILDKSKSYTTNHSQISPYYKQCKPLFKHTFKASIWWLWILQIFKMVWYKLKYVMDSYDINLLWRRRKNPKMFNVFTKMDSGPLAKIPLACIESYHNKAMSRSNKSS